MIFHWFPVKIKIDIHKEDTFVPVFTIKQKQIVEKADVSILTQE